MSLAASAGGGLGGGVGPSGVVLAHSAQGPAGVLPPPHASGTTADAGYGTPLPSAAILGADASDRLQRISLKQVKNVAHLPIVAIDLYAIEPHVATFPPKPDDPAEPVPPRLVGKMKATIALQATEASHKTLRKYLNKTRSYEMVRQDCLIMTHISSEGQTTTTTTKTASSSSASSSSTTTAVVLHHPERFLGIRRLEQVPTFITKQYNTTTTTTTTTTTSTPEEEAAAAASSLSSSVVWTNSTLDGSSVPQGDDFDRVVAHVKLHASKKALSLLPEEAVQLLLHQAQYHVAIKGNRLTSDEITDFPVAIAMPSYAMHDAAIEAMMDATTTTESGTAVIFARSVCALVGALMLPLDGQPSALLERLQQVRQAMAMEFKKKMNKHSMQDAIFEEDVTLILLGMTADGLEATAVQVAHVQQEMTTCLFGDIKVLANVSYMDEHPCMQRMMLCCTELERVLDAVAPDVDGPAGIVLYGTVTEQDAMKKQWNAKVKAATQEWDKVPLFNTKPEAIAMGTALLGAVAHGRQLVLVKKGEKTKAALAIRVQNVAPCAVGVRFHYHGGGGGGKSNHDTADDWTPIKTIFDFDRRIPAGPYAIDFKASECVIYRQGISSLSEEEFIKTSKENEGAKHIPAREEAALDLRVEILQKWTRDGEWVRVGDLMEPLVKMDGDEKRIACESVTLELSMSVTGLLSNSLVGERESVVQATKSARSSAIRYYVGIAFAILFFGGFLIKSYWEEYTLNRDTKKLLAYYKRAVPGSISDGDERSAMIIVYKYRHNKQRLWEKLEQKYGIPVREVYEWDDEEEEHGSPPLGEDGTDETVDMDQDKTEKDTDGEL